MAIGGGIASIWGTCVLCDLNHVSGSDKHVAVIAVTIAGLGLLGMVTLTIVAGRLS